MSPEPNQNPVVQPIWSLQSSFPLIWTCGVTAGRFLKQTFRVRFSRKDKTNNFLLERRVSVIFTLMGRGWSLSFHTWWSDAVLWLAPQQRDAVRSVHDGCLGRPSAAVFLQHTDALLSGSWRHLQFATSDQKPDTTSKWYHTAACTLHLNLNLVQRGSC